MTEFNPPVFSPAQQEILSLLGAKPADRPQFDFALKHQLRATIEHHLEPLAGDIPDDVTLWVSKHALTTVHGCEVKWQAEENEPFGYSVPVARGTVAHKAIELSIHVKGDWPPAELVDEAMARLTEGTDRLAEWLQGIDDIERAELRGEAVDRVSGFVELWPPLESRWRPCTESRERQEFLGGKVVLSGKVDLTVGMADGDRPARSSSTSRPAAPRWPTATISASMRCSTRCGWASPHGCWPATTSTPASPRPNWSPRTFSTPPPLGPSMA